MELRNLFAFFVCVCGFYPIRIQQRYKRLPVGSYSVHAKCTNFQRSLLLHLLLPLLCINYVKSNCTTSKRKKFHNPRMTDLYLSLVSVSVLLLLVDCLDAMQCFPCQFHMVTDPFPMILALISGVRELSTHLAPSVCLCSRQRTHTTGSPCTVSPGEVPSARLIQTLPQSYP